MKKSTLIATLLVNMETGVELQHAERIVAATFADEHPGANFGDWDTELNDDWCKRFISAKGKLSSIRVGQAIDEFWDEPV